MEGAKPVASEGAESRERRAQAHVGREMALDTAAMKIMLPDVLRSGVPGRAFVQWTKARSIALQNVQPNANGYIERFKRIFRGKCWISPVCPHQEMRARQSGGGRTNTTSNIPTIPWAI